MANKFIRYLTGESATQLGRNFVGGLVRPKGIQANWQHASRIFHDDTFRLAPRHKFLYYVLFEIDNSAHRASLFTQRHQQEVGLLVKTAELPKFNFDSMVKNQYNRKKIIYKQINYEPVNLTLHDDSAGIVNALWAIYYGTYVADRSLPESAFKTNHYRPTSTSLDNFRYGLDNNKTVDMFKSISIYTMSRRRFNGYTLVNPRIKSWSHGNLDYGDNTTVESSMSLEYEAVQYSSGDVAVNRPKGFAALHYDVTPSPLTVAGGGSATVSGEGGVLSGLESIFGDISKGSPFKSPAGFLSTAVQSINTYQNIKGLSKESIRQEGINILNSPAAVRGIVNSVGGIINSTFPKAQSGDATTVAAPRKLSE
jgi:hypothetical protein